MDHYCERMGPGFWAEPFNALTNLAFLIAATAMLVRQRSARLEELFVLALLTASVGIGSFMFHTPGQSVVADRGHRTDRGGHLLVLLRGDDAVSAPKSHCRRTSDSDVAGAFADARSYREASVRKFGDLCSRIDRHFRRGFCGTACGSRFHALAAGDGWHDFLRCVGLSDIGCTALRTLECRHTLHLASAQRRRLGIRAPVDRTTFTKGPGSLVVKARAIQGVTRLLPAPAGFGRG